MLRKLVNWLVSAAFALAAVSEGPVHVTAEARVEDPRLDGWHGDGKLVLFANLFVPVRAEPVRRTWYRHKDAIVYFAGYLAEFEAYLKANRLRFPRGVRLGHQRLAAMPANRKWHLFPWR